jgi:hypothetical protein
MSLWSIFPQCKLRVGYWVIEMPVFTFVIACCVSQLFVTVTNIPERTTYKEEMFIYYLGSQFQRFQSMGSWLYSCGPVVRQYIMVGREGGKERKGERERERSRQTDRDRGGGEGQSFLSFLVVLGI